MKLLLIFLFVFSCFFVSANTDSLKTLLKTSNEKGKLRILNKLTDLQMGNNPAEAKEYAYSAIKLSEKLGNDSAKSQALYNLGIIFFYEGDIKKSSEYFLKSLDVRKKSNDTQGIAESYNALGNISLSSGNYEKALAFFNNSLSVNESLKDTVEKKSSMASVFNNIGVIYERWGKYDLSITYYQKSLKIRESLNNKDGMAQAYNNIGNVYYYWADSRKLNDLFYKSIENYEQALKIYEEINDRNKIAKLLSNLGNTYFQIGKIASGSDELKKRNIEKAINFHKKSLEIKQNLSDKNGIAHSLNSLGEMYQESKEYAKAFTFFNDALKLRQELDEKSGIVISLQNIGDNFFYRNLPEEASLKYNEALMLAQKIDLRKEVMNIYEAFIKLYTQKNDFKNAFRYQSLYYDLKDSLFSIDTKKQIEELGVKYETEKKEQQIEILNKETEVKNARLARQNIVIIAVISGITLLTLLVLLVFNRYRLKQKANQQLEQQNKIIQLQSEELKEINTSITDSIFYAQRIQKAVLPSDDFIKSLFPESFVLFRPRDIVSGDFYWANRVKGWVVFSVADCTGHGVPGAFMSMLGVSFLNEIVRDETITTAGNVLNNLRSHVIESLKQKGISGEQQDGMDIAFCAINTNTLEMHFAGANNPLWIIRRKSEISDDKSENIPCSFELKEYAPDKMPIGIYQIMNPFNDSLIQLEVGDSLYIMTDGLGDQFGGPKGKKFRAGQLKDILLSAQGMEMTDQKELLNRKVEEWLNCAETGKHYEQIDDICVMGVKVNRFKN